MVLLGITVYSRRYVRGVTDFLAADRLAGRYLLTVAGGFYGTVGLVANWEMIYATGLPPQWWGMMNLPIGLFLALTGFIVYRFRQTRALTLAQFFEERYSRRFRCYAGILCWASGILNFGVFPFVTGNLIVFFLGLPPEFVFLGVTLKTFWVTMFCYLAFATYIACAGGQITIMITDFLQGAMLMLIFAVLVIYLLGIYSWEEIVSGLMLGGADGESSMINPFAGSSNKDFDIWYFLIGLFGAIYNTRSWQGNSGYNAAARTPHEAVVAGVIGNWRMIVSTICIILIPLAAFAVLHLPEYAATAEPIRNAIDNLGDPVLKTQMTVPLFLKYTLPSGLLGLFAAVIFGCAISCDDTYVHAWGSIFIQDVVLPIRKRPFKTPGNHLLALRLSIVGVALFGFIFSILFPMKGYIFMFFALTGAIYLGGAGAVIIGGLYWKRGTTAAAWCALSVGTVIGFGGICIQQAWPALLGSLMRSWPDWEILQSFPEEFPVNGQWIYFYAMIASTVCYIAVSLLGPRRVFNLDRLLHRGQYAVAADRVGGAGGNRQDVRGDKERFSLKRFLGITSEFTRFERFIFYGTFAWLMGWWLVFVAGVAVNFIQPLSDRFWSGFWYVYILLSVGLGILCTIWIFAGGLRDALQLFRDLRTSRNDCRDDGFVRQNEESAE